MVKCSWNENYSGRPKVLEPRTLFQSIPTWITNSFVGNVGNTRKKKGRRLSEHDLRFN